MEAPIPTDPAQALRAVLDGRGALSSADLQRALGASQPTISRLLASAASQVLVLGRGRSTRYALPHGIGGAGAEQPLAWIDEQGAAHDLGRLAFGSGGWVHVQIDKAAARGARPSEAADAPSPERASARAPSAAHGRSQAADAPSRGEASAASSGVLFHTAGALPWFLAPLRAEGFLGRGLARRLAPQGLPGDPAAWSIEQVLLAALHTPDAPGAIRLGDAAVAPPDELPTLEGLSAPRAAQLLDTLADRATQHLPAGSSAGGEQPKFLLRDHDGLPLIVKFGPPRGTPFGERWNDLLQAEALALEVLGEHGVPVAQARVATTAQRTMLLSRRFDRVGRRGRLHVVPLWAAHDAFVPGPRRHWAATCEVLEARRRLPAGSAAQALALRQFGHLIGNTDMHFGNLSLWVERGQMLAGRLRLAPLYDMLPMRWRPDASSGEMGLLPFEPDTADLASPARPLAATFWNRVAQSPAIGRDFRALAVEQARRCGR